MRLSASQISTFRDCKRKWAWRYIAKIPSLPNASAELGVETHKQLETYLEGGSLDFTRESGEIAASGLEHLPRPNTPGMVLEGEFSFEGPSGHEYLGYKDVELSPHPDGVDIPTVIDHKTTSDLKWQKTKAELLQDPQGVLYAVDAFRKHPEAQEVELKWVYYQTRKTRKSAVTHLRVVPNDILSAFQAIEIQAQEMAEIYTSVIDPLELPPSTEHCSAYGGCSYQGNCNLSPFEKLRSTMSQGTNSLLAKLKANRTGAATEIAVPAAAPTIAPATVNHYAINPPEYQPPPVATLPPPAPPASPASPAHLASPVDIATAVVTEPVARVPAKRGRPRKVDVAPAPGVETEIAETQAQATAAKEFFDKAAAVPVYTEYSVMERVTGAPKKIDALFVDCGPVGKAYSDAYTFILAAKIKLCAAENVSDYRLMPYGTGQGSLAVAVGAELDAQMGNIGFVRIDSHSPEAQAVILEFISRSTMVVR